MSVQNEISEAGDDTVDRTELLQQVQERFNKGTSNYFNSHPVSIIMII